MKVGRKNLGFKITPRMTVGEIYAEYARALGVEAHKYESRSSFRFKKYCALHTKSGGKETPEIIKARAQLKLAEQGSAKHFVEKIVLMVEHMDIPKRGKRNAD